MKDKTFLSKILIAFLLFLAFPKLVYGELGESYGSALFYGVVYLLMLFYSMIYMAYNVISLFTKKNTKSYFHGVTTVVIILFYSITKFWWWAEHPGSSAVLLSPDNNMRFTYLVFLMAVLLNFLFWLKLCYRLLFKKRKSNMSS